jgi:hypothetical protein
MEKEVQTLLCRPVVGKQRGHMRGDELGRHTRGLPDRLRQNRQGAEAPSPLEMTETGLTEQAESRALR